MKKGVKAILIIFSVAIAAFLCLSFFSVRNGEFRISKDKNSIEFYSFNKVKLSNADVLIDGKIYGIKGGKLVKIEGKESGTVKAADKNAYYVVKGKTFSGLYGKKLYSHGLFSADSTGLITVDGKELCFKDGELYTGIFEKIYYTDGVLDTTKDGYCVIDGKEYYFDKGKLYSGLFNGEYYTDGALDTSMDGYRKVDGVTYLFDKGVLFTGRKKGKYFRDGIFAENETGEIKFRKKTYYVEKGLVYTGFRNMKMYKKGLPDKDYNGFKIIDDKEYYFTEGVITEVPDDVPVKILLVGNSYTYYNGMGQMLCKFIKYTGKSALVVRVTKGGWSLRSLMAKTPAYAAWLDGKEIAAGDKKLIEVADTDFAGLDRAGRWDYIICQNNDTLGKTEEGNTAFFETYRKYVSDDKNILFNAVYYGSSTSRDRYNIIKATAEKCGCTLIDTLSYYASYNSYFGRSWLKDLSIGDTPKHPASKGAYLMALCIYTKLYGKDKLAHSNDAGQFIAVYNSDGGYSNEFAPNKFKRKKMTTDYAMKVTKSDAKRLQTFVYKYADSYLGTPMNEKEDSKNEKESG